MTADPDRLAYWLLKNVNQAIREFEMIADSQRIAVAVSGGKDSLTLLRLLDIRRKSAGVNYELVVIHVIGDAQGPGDAVHPPLLEWLQTNHYETITAPLWLPEGEKLPLDCRRCTWNRRKLIFETAQRAGCAVIAFGHHADDLAQTTLMNLLFHGTTETMAPRRNYFGNTIRLIRPLCYLSEKDIQRFARASNFPPPPPECARSRFSRRKFVTTLIDQAESGCKDAKINLLRAGLKNTTSDILDV